MQATTFETRDIALATFLKVSGEYCIGTLPGNNKKRPNERVWLFENNDNVRELCEVFESADPLVPVKKAFRCSSILKNLLNDKDDIEL